jgi:hypothetical protein
MQMEPEIDPTALYTVDQAVRFLMQADPSLTFDEAVREVNMAIEAGRLRIAGYLAPASKR